LGLFGRNGRLGNGGHQVRSEFKYEV
jgi:hypothetical protein